jgi:resuscitation-promoting factor RpfA
MAGRHRKPNTSTSAVTAAKIALTGAVLGGSGLALTNHASAATDNNWDQAAHCGSGHNRAMAAWPVCGGPLSGATPRTVSAGAPAPDDAPLANPKVNVVSTPPLEAPPPTDAPLSAPVPAEDVPAPPPEQAAPVDGTPEPPPPMDAPTAAPEPAQLDLAPASDNQPPPPPQVDPPTDMADAPAALPADDTTKEAELVTLVHKFSGTPYIWGGDSPSGTDCSGLASWLANLATDRPVFGDRFDTSSEESALLARGFHYGTAPGALVIGWNKHHTAVTLADGTPVSSGEGGGIRIGGGGAYEAQFTHHMFLPLGPEGAEVDPAPVDAPATIEMMNSQVPPPEPSADAVDLGGDAAI